MEKELVGGQLGIIGSYDVSFRDGKLVAEAALEGDKIVDLVITKAESQLPPLFAPILEIVRAAAKAAMRS